MQVFQYHVFVCDQQKPDGAPCCATRGGADVLAELRAEIGRQGLSETVLVTACGSLGLCERGPNIVVYPEGTWYSGVQRADVTELVRSHFRDGRVVERLANRDAAALRGEIADTRARASKALGAKEASGAVPDALLQTIRGFQESRVVLTAIELDVFSAVAESDGTAPAVAKRIGADRRATEMLLNALTAMHLVNEEGDRFTNAPVAARYLAAGGAHDSRLALLHTVHLWERWSRLTDSVRAGTSAYGATVPEPDERWTEAFIAAMHKNATERAPAVVSAAGGEPARRMLDIGGGSGAYAIAFATAHPHLQVELLDVPTVTPIAERNIAEAGMADRVRTRNGDLRSASLGENHDIILVSAICHMLSPEENRALFARCLAAAAPGGRLIVQDFILEHSKTAPRSGALFALNMLVGTPAGGTYSEEEYASWLGAAGFTGIEHVRLAGPTGLMIGFRPPAP